MPELLVDLLAAIGVIVLSLIWYFYLYPAMKKEYERNGWTWGDGRIGFLKELMFMGL